MQEIKEMFRPQFKLSKDWNPKNESKVPVENFPNINRAMISTGGRRFILRKRKNMKYPKLISELK